MSLVRREPVKRASVLVTLPPVVKKTSKSRSFHFRYLELCRAKNLTPVPNIRSNPNATTFLELFGDKLGVSDWQLIIEALHYDLVLQTLVIRMRRSNGNNIVLPIDTENRARLFRQKPVIYTRFIFYSLVEAISNCVKLNKNLTVLKLEGLPLQDSYIECIAKSLASNDCLKEVSFQKSYIGDKGCEVVCSTVKYLNHVEIFNISECNISSKGAEFVADMIKMQKITRFSEGWEKSLRYRSVDTNSISGLRSVYLANNPNLGDEGLRPIAEVLKEDAWVKTIDMENCGLTDRGANIILECLSLNTAITEFNLRHNEGISKFLMRQIRDHFGKEDEEKLNEPQYDLSCVNGLQSLPKSQKYTVSQLLTHTKTLEEQLSFERTLRKKAEKLNEKLNNQLMSTEQNAPPPSPPEKIMDGGPLPKGYVLVKNDFLQSVIKNSQQYPGAHVSQLVNSAVTSPSTTPRSDNGTLRKQPQDSEPELQQQSEEEEEEETFMALPDEQPAPRQVLQVRKVRSEMKYVEANCKESAKKRESKSDHEFANERDFKLNSKLHFEVDIGDSVMATQQHLERRRHEAGEMGAGIGDGYDDGDADVGYEQQMLHKSRGQAPWEGEYIGDGHEGRKHMAKNKKHGYGDMGNSHMAVYMAELERKINSSGKKRHKSKMQTGGDSKHARDKKKDKAKDNEPYMQVHNINIDSYMANMEETPSDCTVTGSDSEEPNAERTGRAQVAPMKVFMRRTHYESDTVELQHDDDNDDDEQDEPTEQRIISPRSVYLQMQKKHELM